MRHPHEFESPGCREVGGDWWFPDKNGNLTELKMARTICVSCIHRTECAEWGIVNESFGIWGGTTEQERAALRRQRGIRVREDFSA